MTGRPSPKRGEVIAHAWRQYHAGRISFAQLVATVLAFRARMP